jgi:tetratricopeptide (TPR) repeat protein
VELQAAADAATEGSAEEHAGEDAGDGASVQVEGAHRALHEMVARGGSFSGRERNCAFINTRDGKFAAAASAVGFDFPDDARAVVTLDYDGDGDVDVITTNRTAPRLRVLLNRSERLSGSDRSHHVSLDLRGDQAGNRSAIGATVELLFDAAPPIVRSVTAGSGFLGASSTRLTIGVGAADSVRDLHVTWPGGEVESFGSLAVDGDVAVLRQGSGTIEHRVAWKLVLKTSGAATATATATAIDGPGCDGAVVSSYLTLPEPLPPIERGGEAFAWRDLEMEPHALSHGAEGPRVVTLWSLGCRACADEMNGWKTSNAPYPILALSVDEVMAEAKGESFDSSNLEIFAMAWPELDGQGVTFGTASYELLQTLQAAVDRPFARDEDLALPATIVLNAAGQIASVHRGHVAQGAIAQELEFLRSPAAENADALRERVTPLKGRWLAPAPKFSTISLARAWLDSGQARAASDVLLRAEARGEWALDAPATRPASRVAAEAARILYEAGDLPHAIEAANLTSKMRPEWAKGHFNRAAMLDAAGRFKEAEAAYTTVLNLRARHWQALANRGRLRGRDGRKAEGLSDLRQALKTLPKKASTEQRAQLQAMIDELAAKAP